MRPECRSNPPRQVGTLLLLALMFFLLTILWVPVNPEPIAYGKHYYEANLWTEPTLRALPGTVANLLGLGPGGFIVGILLFQLLWLFLILVGLCRTPAASGDAPHRSGTAIGSAVIMLGFLFFFNSVVSTTNAIGGTVDVVAYALILLALFLCEGESEHSRLRVVAAAGLAVTAALVHEKTALDIAIVSMWLIWKQGWRRGLGFMIPAGIGVVLCLLLLGEETTVTPSPAKYWQALSGSLALPWSLNLWGVFLAGGMLWGIFLLSAARFLRQGTYGTGRWDKHRALVVLLMLSPCFLPLLVAVDTSRMVNLMWLPTFLLVREVDLAGMMSRSYTLRKSVLLLCLLQLLTPPLFVYKQRAVPLNCYARRALYLLVGAEGALALPYPLGLRATRRPDITRGNECWPPIRRALPRRRTS